MVSRGGFIAYYRVSTGKQGKSGLGIEAQRAAVENYLNGGNWRITAEFTEVESGKRSDRPELTSRIGRSAFAPRSGRRGQGRSADSLSGLPVAFAGGWRGCPLRRLASDRGTNRQIHSAADGCGGRA